MSSFISLECIHYSVSEDHRLIYERIPETGKWNISLYRGSKTYQQDKKKLQKKSVLPGGTLREQVISLWKYKRDERKLTCSYSAARFSSRQEVIEVVDKVFKKNKPSHKMITHNKYLIKELKGSKIGNFEFKKIQVENKTRWSIQERSGIVENWTDKNWANISWLFQKELAGKIFNTREEAVHIFLNWALSNKLLPEDFLSCK